MRIGFLFNHEALHQIAHTAPVVAELARRGVVELVVLTSGIDQEERVRAILGDMADRVQFVRLAIGPASRMLNAGLQWFAPSRRIAMLRDNLPSFAALDVLVVPETTSLLLRDRFGLDRLKMVWIPHGAGDRSVGFRDVMRGFDLVLLSGTKVRDRMLAQGLIAPDDHVVIGYPKFDSVALDMPPEPLFARDRPTILYNPHFDPRLSSWYSMGEDILDWFAGQERFNLIFAPHVMLFKRRLHASVEHRRVRLRRDVPKRHRDRDHLLIDAGSVRSVDMTYTRAADIYLGDASSQIYEWIARPRPAIFLNPGRVDWAVNPDFAHWHLGQVIERIDQLPGALDGALSRFGIWRTRQEQAFRHTFDVTDVAASRRAADAIIARYGAG